MTGSMALPSLMTTLIPWAISSVLLILAVLAVRWLTRDRLSSVNRYALWLVVLIRLLIPIQLPFLSSLGAVDLAPQMENTPVYAFPTGHMDAPERYIQHIREEQGEDPVMSAGVTSRDFPALGGIGFDYYNGGTILEENGYTDYAFFSTVPRILSILWGAGALVMLLCLVGNNLRFAARRAAPAVPWTFPSVPFPSTGWKACPPLPVRPVSPRHLPHSGGCGKRNSPAPCTDPRGDPLRPQGPHLVRPPVYRPGPPLV